MKRQLALLFFITLFSATSFSQVYKWIDEKGRMQFSDKPNPRSINQPATHSSPPLASKNITHKHKSNSENHPHDNNVIKIRRLFNKSEFTKLNTLLSSLDASYQSGEISEDSLLTAYEAFKTEDRNANEKFEQWIKLSPSIFQPYLAKGTFEYWKGWNIRGNQFSHKTKEDKLNKFRKHLALAKENIEIAINMNERSLSAYYYLMNIFVSIGEDQEVIRTMKAALEVDKTSFYIRSLYIKHISPRWGGSAEAMRIYISSLSRDINRFPKLKPLKGYLYKEAGDLEGIDSSYQISIEHYTEALTSGETHQVLFSRGKNYYRIKDYKNATKDLSKAININPEKPNYYYWRAKVHNVLDDSNALKNDLDIAYLLDPYNKKIIKMRKKFIAYTRKSEFKAKQNKKAGSLISGLSSKLEQNPNNGDLLLKRSQAYYQKEDLDSALIDIKRAIKINPDEYEYYMFIDYVLIKQGDLDQIVKYWKQYIRRNPEDSRAYSEIAGTYSHKKDIHSAIKYSKMSADLGDAEGFYYYEKFKEILETQYEN